MSEHKRLHPLSIIFSVIKVLKDAFLPFVVIIFSSLMQGKFGNLLWLLIVIPAVVGVAIGWGVLSWLRYQYIVEDGVLKVERGVLFRKKQYIAQSRIQTIDVVEGLVQRLFGVVKLQVQTAGGQKPEAIMSAVSRADAEQIRRQLLEIATNQYDHATDEGSTLTEESDIAIDGPSYLLSGPRLFIMAVTSSSIGVVASFLAAGYTQVGNFLGDDNIFNLLSNWLYEIPIAFTIVGALIVSWVLAIVGTVLKYYGFSIRLSAEKLHINRGLLERRQVAIPVSRIQAIRIVESPIRQPFGWLSVYVESAGYGKGKGESTLLFPLLRRSELSEFIATMTPQFQVEYELNRLPRRSMRKYVSIHTLIALLLSAPFCYFAPWGYLALLIVPISAAWGFAKYKESGWSWVKGSRMLIMRSRFVERTIVYIPHNRIQFFQLSQSPFQRKSDLATITATVASNGQSGSSFKVKHIASEDSSFLLTTLRNKRS